MTVKDVRSEVIDGNEEGSAYDRVRELLDEAEAAGQGFIYIGPSIQDGVEGSAIITPIEDPADVLSAMESAISAMKTAFLS